MMILSGTTRHSQVTIKEVLVTIILLGNIYLSIEIVLRNTGAAGLYEEINLIINSCVSLNIIFSVYYLCSGGMPFYHFCL